MAQKKKAHSFPFVEETKEETEEITVENTEAEDSKEEIEVETEDTENSEQETVVETEETKAVEEVKPLRGKVVDCEGLNVRSEPSLNASIISVLRKDTIVPITDEGDPKFFKTLSGYVMKDYIKVL